MIERKKRTNNQDKGFDSRILHVARCARIVAGGRRFSFRVTAVMGDKNGKIGLGVGKGKSVSSAMEKAKRQAQKGMIKVNLTNAKTIAYEVNIKFKRASLLLRPRRNELVAGGVVRIMAQLVGIKALTAKIIGTSITAGRPFVVDSATSLFVPEAYLLQFSCSLIS